MFRYTALAVLICCGVAHSADPPASQPADQADTYEVYFRCVLRNKTDGALDDVHVWLPVPQDSDYQRIGAFQTELWGQPFAVERQEDRFGQPLVRITIARLEPNQTVEVGYSCDVLLRVPPKVQLDPARAGALEDVPADLRALYTTDLKDIYDLSSPEIRRVAGELLAKHPNPVARALAIHDFVAGRLKYVREGGWDAAPTVLERGSGSCSEFSFLFCALCRATGLPTRFVGASNGPAAGRRARLPHEDTVLHRWAEVYLPPYGWVPFDPTADRGEPPKRAFVGTFRPRVLIVSKRDAGPPLGQAYVVANDHPRDLEWKRAFVWTRGARAAFERATELAAAGHRDEADMAYQEIAAKYKGSRWAKAAEQRVQTK